MEYKSDLITTFQLSSRAIKSSTKPVFWLYLLLIIVFLQFEECEQKIRRVRKSRLLVVLKVTDEWSLCWHVLSCRWLRVSDANLCGLTYRTWKWCMHIFSAFAVEILLCTCVSCKMCPSRSGSHVFHLFWTLSCFRCPALISECHATLVGNHNLTGPNSLTSSWGWMGGWVGVGVGGGC